MTTGQAELVEIAEESLRAAKLLIENGFAGFASSRAYYTMFTVAEAFLLSKDLTFARHSAVIAAFAQHFANAGVVPREFHRWIINAQDHRHIADYGGDQPVTDEEARADIGHAGAFLAELKKFLDSKPE